MPELYDMMMMKKLSGDGSLPKTIDADSVDDTNSEHKFVSSDEKTKIANALTTEVYNAGKQVVNGNKTGEIFNNYTSNKATGNMSHAEGYSTTAGGITSHAEGYSTKATNDYTHAEGNMTTASGNISHAEGYYTTASATTSHAEGSYTIAASANQHVQGKYNVEDSAGKYAFIIGNGNGNSASSRSNALAVDWDEKIYVGNSAVGIDLNDLLSRIEALENA